MTRIWAGTLSLSTWMCSACVAQSSFHAFDLPAGAQSNGVVRISDDGSTVAGSYTGSAGTTYCLWQQDRIVTVDTRGRAITSLSADGSVVVGSGVGGVFWWSEQEGFHDLRNVIPSGLKRYFDTAVAISGDGLTVVGWSEYGGQQGSLRYHIPTDHIDWLNPSCGQPLWCGVTDAVPDTSVVVGGLFCGAFILTPAGSTCPDGPIFSTRAVSPDGQTLVGQMIVTYPDVTEFPRPYCWSGGVLENLGTLPSALGAMHEALDVSGDGTIVVGQSGCSAFVWSTTAGIVRIKDELERAGLDLSGWRLRSAVGISPDSFYIIGDGIDPEGRVRGWISHVELPTQPRCYADWNRNDSLDSSDFFDFLIGFFNGDADYDQCGTTTSDDFFQFVAAFFEGCL